ncbi:MAG: VWA domain-containing protein [Planctomycetales bacterium]|nr:VWA domain-containing protein [Planctomycetales bacterium]
MTATPQPAPEPHYGFSTLAPFQDQPGATLVGLVLMTLVIAVVVLLYWRERSSLTAMKMFPLLVLRLLALAGVALFALGPEKRDAKLEVRPSRVLLLVDDSLSMALADAPDASHSDPIPRWRSVQNLLAEQGLLATLQESHEVHVAAVSDPRAALVFPLRSPALSPAPPEPTAGEDPDRLSTLLTASTSQTRLGDALETVVAANAGGPLAAIVLASDGQNNSGASPEMSANLAGEAGVPVHTLGLGSEKPMLNLAVRDLVAPRRAYPRDETSLTALIELQAEEKTTTAVALYSKQLTEGAPPESLLETRTIEISPEEGARSITFLTQPPGAGEYQYRIEVRPLAGEKDLEDNSAVVQVQVVDRLIKVLLIAGGPTRDYRFLRDQLRRDESFTVDVLLQSAPAGISQNADHALTSLPSDPEALGAYDLFVALDADWLALPRSEVRELEQCVSQRGAGFVFSAGPIHTPRWLRDGAAREVLNLLPVTPAPLPLLLGAAERSRSHPASVRLTPAGREAEFLWVKREQQPSLRFWESLPGFYSTAKRDKVNPGATIYALTGEEADDSHVLFAEQFYGSGRCFYVGAPELWRLRAVDPVAMTSLYTKLLQHLSQGRLLADSTAGSLVFERDRYNVGDTLTLRATLPGAAFTNRPQGATVPVLVETPRGETRNLALTKTEAAGTAWTASLRGEWEGVYQASLLPAGEPKPLAAKTSVFVPALERSQTQRNAALLEQIAEVSGGNYYATESAALSGDTNTRSLAEAIPSRTETVTLYGAPDDAFAYRVARWLLTVIGACLLLEWALRRVWSLA